VFVLGEQSCKEQRNRVAVVVVVAGESRVKVNDVDQCEITLRWRSFSVILERFLRARRYEWSGQEGKQCSLVAQGGRRWAGQGTSKRARLDGYNAAVRILGTGL
jgi:hypothetical protein